MLITPWQDRELIANLREEHKDLEQGMSLIFNLELQKIKKELFIT